jgi:hypothetical protein
MDDFFTFLQLFVIFMISSGVAITAVLYPHYPLGLELFSKAFVFRGLMALFSSEMSDLKNQHQSCSINATSQTESEYACLRLSHGLSFKCKIDNVSPSLFELSEMSRTFQMTISTRTIAMASSHHAAISPRGSPGFSSSNISSWQSVFSLRCSQPCLGECKTKIRKASSHLSS